jgi:hypothetical protein
MSLYDLRPSSKAFLRYLANHEEAPQYSFKTNLRYSYKTVIRELHQLEDMGLMQLHRTESSSKNGKDQNIWRITLAGLCFAITETQGDQSKIEQIIRSQQNIQNIIFNEWDYISNNNTAKTYVISNVFKWAQLTTSVLMIARIKDFKRMYDFMVASGIGIRVDKGSYLPSDLSLYDMAFGIDKLLGVNIYWRDKLDGAVSVTLDYLIKNGNIKTIIFERIASQEENLNHKIEVNNKILNYVDTWKKSRGL